MKCEHESWHVKYPAVPVTDEELAFFETAVLTDSEPDFRSAVKRLKLYWMEHPRELTDVEIERCLEEFDGDEHDFPRHIAAWIQRNQFYAPAPQLSEEEKAIEALKEEGSYSIAAIACKNKFIAAIDEAVRLGKLMAQKEKKA